MCVCVRVCVCVCACVCVCVCAILRAQTPFLTYAPSSSLPQFQPGVPPNFDQPRSWSASGPDGSAWPFDDLHTENATNLCKEHCCGANGTHYCLYDIKQGDNGGLSDQFNSRIAFQRLGQAISNYKNTGQPFFVGMGFHKPHLPWHFPKQFYDALPPISEVPEAVHQAWPADTPHIGWHECAEMSHPYYDTNGWGVPPGQGVGAYFSGHQAEMRKAYMGAISYVDDLMGHGIKMLEDTGVYNDTVVMVTG